jgi:hypothetical protein
MALPAYVFRTMTVPDLPREVIDPDSANAMRTHKKAGFCRDRRVAPPDGPVLLMVRDPPTPPRGTPAAPALPLVLATF